MPVFSSLFIMYFIFPAILLVAGKCSKKTGLNLYRFMAVSLSIASIPASVITAYASWHATIQNFMPETLEQDAEGLNAILNIISTGTWGVFSIVALVVSLLVSFALHAAGAGILWMIYAIIYHKKQKT